MSITITISITLTFSDLQ